MRTPLWRSPPLWIVAVATVSTVSLATLASLPSTTGASPLDSPPTGEVPSPPQGYILIMPSPPVLQDPTVASGLRQQAGLTPESAVPGSTQEDVSATDLQARITTLRDALLAEQDSEIAIVRSIVPTADTTVSSRYIYSLNAVAMTGLSDAAAADIAAYVPEVEVVPNNAVQLALDQSVQQIGANALWFLQANGTGCQPALNNCLTGRGVRVGIIDTGIDYTHPDLGGCFGAGCKVRGGWDFANNDANPMDDHGHGTHVASIVAGRDSTPPANGRGVETGVAPDATLFAYKITGGAGSTTANLISALERSMDPNQDGNLTDRMDVINISLGCATCHSSDDPTSLAVDNVVGAGVVAVVAAGNTGPNDWTVNAPGTAREAITVGAFTKQGTLAEFSSRGPTAEFLLKPDVTAPGVDICAAEWGTFQSSLRCKDTRHISISGTSMATPHVAGLAAIMRQAHPSWTPEQIKSTLRNTAVRTGSFNVAAVRQQGYGIVSAQAAVLAATPFEDVTLLTAGLYEEQTIPIDAEVDAQNVASWTVSVQNGNTGTNTVVATGTGQPADTVTNLAASILDREVPYFLLLEVKDTAGRVYRDATVIMSTRPPDSANVAITANAPASLQGGTTSFTHTLTVTNAGVNTAKGIVVSYGLPPSVTLASSNASCSTQNGTVTCPAFDLVTGANRSITLNFTFSTIPPCNAPLRFNGRALATTSDPQPADNTIAVDMQMGCVDMVVCNGVQGVTTIPSGYMGLLQLAFKNMGTSSWAGPQYNMIPDPAYASQKLSTFNGASLPFAIGPKGTITFNIPVKHTLPSKVASANVAVVGKIAKSGTAIKSDAVTCGRVMKVTSSTAPKELPKYQCVSVTGPKQLKVGQQGTVIFTLKNKGATSWAVGKHKLLPDYTTLSSNLFGFNGVDIPKKVPKKGKVTINVPVQGTVTGTFTVYGEMAYNGIYPKTAPTCGVSIQVIP